MYININKHLILRDVRSCLLTAVCSFFCQLQLIYQIRSNGISALVELQPDMEVNHGLTPKRYGGGQGCHTKRDFLFPLTWNASGAVCLLRWPPVGMMFKIFVVPKYWISAHKHISKPPLGIQECWLFLSLLWSICLLVSCVFIASHHTRPPVAKFVQNRCNYLTAEELFM